MKVFVPDLHFMNMQIILALRPCNSFDWTQIVFIFKQFDIYVVVYTQKHAIFAQLAHESFHLCFHGCSNTAHIFYERLYYKETVELLRSKTASYLHSI